MAYIDPNNPNQQQQGNPSGPSQAVGQTSLATGSSPLTGNSQSAFTGGGGPTSTAPSSGQGQGGGDGWTNIQNYLSANAGNQGSANLLGQNAQTTLGNEHSQFDNQASQARGQAQNQVQGVNQDQASQLLGQASSQYGQGGSGYQGIVQQLQGMINNPYSGPKSGDFSYGMSGNTQSLGQAMGGDQGSFNSYMQGLYGQAAGQLTPGEQAFQSQLDSGNQPLQDARQNALSQYNGLNSYIGSQSQAVNSDLGNYANQYAQNQQGIRNTLNSTATGDQNAINAQIARDDGYLSSFAPSLNETLYPGTNQSETFSWAFNPSSGPNQNNVAGVDSQRNNFNTIQDVLGTGAGIVSQTYDPSQASFHQTASDTPQTYQGGGPLADQTLSQIMNSSLGTNSVSPTTYQQIQDFLNQPYQAPIRGVGPMIRPK